MQICVNAHSVMGRQLFGPLFLLQVKLMESQQKLKSRSKCEFVANKFSSRARGLKISANKKRWLAGASSPSLSALSFLIGQQKLRERSWKRPLRGRHPPHTPPRTPPIPALHPRHPVRYHSRPGLSRPDVSTDSLDRWQISQSKIFTLPSSFWPEAGLNFQIFNNISTNHRRSFRGWEGRGKLGKKRSNHLRDLMHFKRFKFSLHTLPLTRSLVISAAFRNLGRIWWDGGIGPHGRAHASVAPLWVAKL